MHGAFSKRRLAESPIGRSLRVLRRRMRAARLRTREQIQRRIPGLRMSPEAYAFDCYKRERLRICTADLSKLRDSAQDAFVSIVLPVYNGERYLAEALASVLAQTYRHFEIIAVDDGSTDSTPAILEAAARADARIRIVRQANQGLPRALSNGFRESRGAFLTWISADNRLARDFLAKMTSCLTRHPNWDAIYANQDLIDERGNRMTGTERYPLFQKPDGSGHVRFPGDVSALNTGGDNYVGAAFMYRSRVRVLIGDYSDHLFGLEDYDYWMRINELMTLRHADFSESVYAYRYHGDSLTSRHRELGIEAKRRRLLSFDRFRRDFCLRPMTWHVVSDDTRLEVSRFRHEFEQAAGSNVTQSRELAPGAAPAVRVDVRSGTDALDAGPPAVREGMLNVLVTMGPDPAAGPVSSTWDLCIAWSKTYRPQRLAHARQGWLATSDFKTLIAAIDIRARADALRRLEPAFLNAAEGAFTAPADHRSQHASRSLWTSLSRTYDCTVAALDARSNAQRRQHWQSTFGELRLLGHHAMGLSRRRRRPIVLID